MRPDGLNFELIREQLDTLLDGMELNLERQFPSTNEFGERETLWLLFKVSLNTYRTIRWICADSKEESRYLQYSVSCPALVRTLVDHLCSVVFLLENLGQRALWYSKAGWREHVEKYQMYVQEFGSQPEWQSYLNSLHAANEWGAKLFCVTDEERANINSIPYWPIPSQMIKSSMAPGPDAASRVFLRYLDAWFYRELSQQSHLSYPGLADRASLLLAAARNEPQAESNLRQFKSTQVVMTITMMLAICSELETAFHFGFRTKIAVLWGIMNAGFPLSREVHEHRYADLLRDSN